MILNSTKPSTGNKDSIGMPTLHIGPQGSEEFSRQVKGFSFIVIGDVALFSSVSHSVSLNMKMAFILAFIQFQGLGVRK